MQPGMAPKPKITTNKPHQWYSGMEPQGFNQPRPCPNFLDTVGLKSSLSGRVCVYDIKAGKA